MTDSFWGNIFRSRDREEEGVLAILRGLPFFEDLSRKELTAIERILHRREYKPGEVIFYQGDSGVGMYIIEKGTVAIILEPTEQVLAELHEGEFFGEMALLNESPRSATAIARTHCTLLFFSHEELFSLMDREIKCGLKIVLRLAQITGERLRRSNEQCQALQEELHTLREQLKTINQEKAETETLNE